MMDKKIMFYGGILVVLVFASGILVTSATDNAKLQNTADEVMAYCNDELLPAYEEGFMTRLIDNLGDFAIKCTPGDVKLNAMVSVSGEKIGIVLICYIGDKINDTYAFEYPDVEEFR